MPPNLGGFFMVRSYYPSECHADYFDFERIEALKPAIEACGISTLSQSPMLGFHKQMDNRIKLLEEILSFRMHTRRQVAIQNRVASNIGISQSTFSVKVLNLFSRSRRKTNKRKSKHSAMLRNKE